MANSHKTTTRADAHPPGEVSDYILMDEQGSDPATPASTKWAFYVKSGGVYARNAAGTVIGPLIAAGTGTGLVSDITFVIDGGGSAITTGVKGDLICDFGCTINSATLLADQAGAIVVDVFKCTYAQYDAGATHPVSGDKITSGTPPTITASNTKSQDTTLSSWTTSISAGDVLRFNVNSATTITRVTLILKVTRT